MEDYINSLAEKCEIRLVFKEDFFGSYKALQDGDELLLGIRFNEPNYWAPILYWHVSKDKSYPSEDFFEKEFFQAGTDKGSYELAIFRKRKLINIIEGEASDYLAFCAMSPIPDWGVKKDHFFSPA